MIANRPTFVFSPGIPVLAVEGSDIFIRVVQRYPGGSRQVGFLRKPYLRGSVRWSVVKTWPTMPGFLARGTFWFVGVASLNCSQILRGTTRFEVFTIFACLIAPVSSGVNQTLLNGPAWDTSTAFCQRVRSWLHWVVITG